MAKSRDQGPSTHLQALWEAGAVFAKQTRFLRSLRDRFVFVLFPDLREMVSKAEGSHVKTVATEVRRIASERWHQLTGRDLPMSGADWRRIAVDVRWPYEVSTIEQIGELINYAADVYRPRWSDEAGGKQRGRPRGTRGKLRASDSRTRLLELILADAGKTDLDKLHQILIDETKSRQQRYADMCHLWPTMRYKTADEIGNLLGVSGSAVRQWESWRDMQDKKSE